LTRIVSCTALARSSLPVQVVGERVDEVQAAAIGDIQLGVEAVAGEQVAIVNVVPAGQALAICRVPPRSVGVDWATVVKLARVVARVLLSVPR